MAGIPLSEEQRKEALAAFAKYGSKIDAANALGLSINTFKHRLAVAQAAPPEQPDAPSRRRIVQLEDENRRLRDEIKSHHRDALDEDEVRGMIGTLAYTPPNPPKWLSTVQRKKAGVTSEVPVLMLSDWHRGEVVSSAEVNGVNEYNSEIMEQRARRVVERAISLASEHGPGNYPGIVCALVGDFVSGGLHPELAKTDDEEPIVSALRVSDVLMWALQRLGSVWQSRSHDVEAGVQAVCLQERGLACVSVVDTSARRRQEDQDRCAAKQSSVLSRMAKALPLGTRRHARCARR
jgi:hypothetical protein